MYITLGELVLHCQSKLNNAEIPTNSGEWYTLHSYKGGVASANSLSTFLHIPSPIIATKRLDPENNPELFWADFKLTNANLPIPHNANPSGPVDKRTYGRIS